jgi:hypothetical protein
MRQILIDHLFTTTRLPENISITLSNASDIPGAPAARSRAPWAAWLRPAGVNRVIGPVRKRHGGAMAV